MTNPCNQSVLLSVYLDGELPKAQSDALTAHLDNCPECRRSLAALRDNDALIRNLPVLEPSTDFERTFWEKVDALEEDTRRPWINNLLRGWRPVWAGAMAGLAVAVVIYFKSAGPLTPEDVFMAEHMELLEEFDLIGQLEMLEHLEATNAMKELT